MKKRNKKDAIETLHPVLVNREIIYMSNKDKLNFITEQNPLEIIDLVVEKDLA